MNNMFSMFNTFGMFGKRRFELYKPYINYTWSNTFQVADKMYSKDSGTAGLNLQQFFGQGCWFNGIDMSIGIGRVPVSGNTTLVYSFVPTLNSRIFGRMTWDSFVGFSTVSATEGVVRCRFTGTDTVFTPRLTLGVPYNITLVLKPDVIDLWVNNILKESISHTYTFAHPLEFIGRNSTAFANCVIKDIYIYNKHLTTTEIEKYTNQPNQFFMDSLEDGSCVLAMPMCEKNNLVRNYKNNTDYPITNYLTTCRTNAKNLQYGLQTSGFKRDSNGLILSKSSFLEADGVGHGNTGWIPSANGDWSIEFIGKFVNNGLEQAHGTLYESPTSRVSISAKLSGELLTRCGWLYTIAGSNGFVENNVVMTYDSTLKIMKQFLNGVFIAEHNVSTFTGAVNPFALSSQGGTSYKVTGDTRLFKVHQKVLTQEEVTKNFNKYQAQGLLNE